MVKTRSRIHWRVLPPNKVHLNVQNVWVSNSVANNVDKLKYQSLVNMDGFGLKWNCDGFWWAVPQVIFLHKFSKLDLYSVYGYITTSPWLQVLNIFQNCTFSTYSLLSQVLQCDIWSTPICQMIFPISTCQQDISGTNSLRTYFLPFPIFLNSSSSVGNHLFQ